MRTIAILLLCLSVASCGWVDRVIATGAGVSRICVDGVLYLQFTSGASVAYDQSGKVRTCR